jgi:phosphatidylserine decarboxylase
VSTIPKIRIRREGGPFILIFGIITLVFFYMAVSLGWVGLILTVWCIYFFRDPDRVTPTDPKLVISPADGVIQMIAEASPPRELGMEDRPLKRVSVFMNVFDCHVNRSPVDGTILSFAYRPGKFLNASLDKASEENERRAMRLKTPDGQELAVVQIAGLVARRIVCWAFDGQKLATGERYGMIRFGSRVDVYLPDDSRVLVVPGQRATAGETVLAELNSSEPDRQGEVL